MKGRGGRLKRDNLTRRVYVNIVRIIMNQRFKMLSHDEILVGVSNRIEFASNYNNNRIFLTKSYHD